MSTHVLTAYDDTPWVRRPDEVETAARLDTPLPVNGPLLENHESGSTQLIKAIFEEFVRLVEGIPKVWAVYIRSDSPVVHVWTFVDSTDWRDRSPVFDVEWEMLSRYPKTPFDFNVELAPAGSEQFEGEETAYLFRR